MEIRKSTQKAVAESPIKPRNLETVRAEHDTIKAELRALTIRRAQREVDNPELFFCGDEEHGRLTDQIFKMREEMGVLARELASAEGRLLTFACAEAIGKEHRYCRGQFKSGGKWLRCGCECHSKPKEAKTERG